MLMVYLCSRSVEIGNAFMGYHADTCAAIILHVCQEKRCDDAAIQEIEEEVCHTLFSRFGFLKNS